MIVKDGIYYKITLKDPNTSLETTLYSKSLPDLIFLKTQKFRDCEG